MWPFQDEHLESLVFHRRWNYLNLSWFFTDDSPTIGWFGYAPLTDTRFAEVIGDMGPDFWVFSLQILGIASLLASLISLPRSLICVLQV